MVFRRFIVLPIPALWLILLLSLSALSFAAHPYSLQDYAFLILALPGFWYFRIESYLGGKIMTL